MAPVKRIFVDVETGGLTPKHAIVQLAAIFDVDGKEVDRFSVECAPFAGDLLDLVALDVSGRTPEQVKAYPIKANGAHSQFVKWLGMHLDQYDRADKAHWLGYNARFDVDMVRAWFDKASDKYFGSWFWSAPVDVMSLAADRLLAERHTMPNFKLATVCERAGIAIERAHDALADIEATRSLYYWARGEGAQR